MSPVDGSELRGYFLSEAEDHINTLHRGITELETSPEREEVMEEIFRAAHTLKGAAALVKLTATSTIAHKMEDILEAVKDKQIRVTPDISELLLTMIDAISGIVHDIAQGREERLEISEQMLLRADEVLSEVKTLGPPAKVAVPAPLEPPAELVRADLERRGAGRRKSDIDFFSGNAVKVDVQKIDEMLNLIGEVTVKKNYLLQRTKGAGEIAEEILFAGKRLNREVSSFVDRYAYSLPDGAKYVDPLFSEFGELEFDRYDEQNLFSRKLQEVTDDITEALKELSQVFDFFHDDVKAMDTMIRMLRANLSETRMIEIGRLLQRFVRPIKDMAKQYGKEVAPHITGGDTKIDRVIFEGLFDPLMHIVRNAISHGIEKAEERLEGGKPREGRIGLSARRDGVTIVIEISDDGRGIDSDKLFAEGLKRGIFMHDALPSREELLSLIFVAGFTTAESADITSGRGVGMSAVKKQVAAINGVVEVVSDPVSGTTFRIKVPSSLAITNVIVFSYGVMEFAMPVSLVEEVIALDPSDGDQRSPATITHRDRIIQTRSLSEIFNVPVHADKSNRFVLVCNISDKRVGLIVNDILGQEETVIKPVNRFLSGLSVYSGVTISGDGRVRLVINPVMIFEEQFQPLAVKSLVADEHEGKRVLVVDDSLSVRKYVSAFLADKDLKVFTASNGVEALKVLEDSHMDLIITDLEMPVMHGYELISALKSSERLKEIPVIVLTSRGTEKHKDRALEIGADDYLVKPFDETSLLASIRKYLLLPA